MRKKSQRDVSVLVPESTAAKSFLGIEIHRALGKFADGGFAARTVVQKIASSDIHAFQMRRVPIFRDLNATPLSYRKTGSKCFVAGNHGPDGVEEEPQI